MPTRSTGSSRVQALPAGRRRTSRKDERLTGPGSRYCDQAPFHPYGDRGNSTTMLWRPVTRACPFSKRGRTPRPSAINTRSRERSGRVGSRAGRRRGLHPSLEGRCDTSCAHVDSLQGQAEPRARRRKGSCCVAGASHRHCTLAQWQTDLDRRTGPPSYTDTPVRRAHLAARIEQDRRVRAHLSLVMEA